jgi:GDP/UDP-N,N'-diacetylbacillosamine 2-epimerase (hydrolysing)
MRKICIITGTRAEYGLLYWLMKEIQADPELELQLVVTGMHLSPEFGLTWKQIEDDGFNIHRKVEMLLSSDTPVGISKSMGVALIGFADSIEDLKPDIVVLLGDRFEIFVAATAAMVARIPIAHLHGGESTEGAFDEAMRHSITKMSHLHFTAAEEYKNRVIQLGEDPARVFNVGGLGIDNIKRLKLLSKNAFEESIHFKLNKKNLLVTFHPVTLEENTTEDQTRALLEALNRLDDTHFIFTKPNADTDSRVIIRLIDDFVEEHSQKAVSFISLGQLRYLSALQYVDGVVGNSSSGLAEAPSFKIGTVNIGDRQAGRLKASSIIDCVPDEKSINHALKELYSAPFQDKLKIVENPYGNGGASQKIKEVLRTHDLDDILKKRFYSIG